jgi:hypothetical protein
MRLVRQVLALAAALRTAHANAHPAGVRIVLSCSPSTAHPFFRRCARDYGASLRRQPKGDLGQKMRRAMAAELAHGPVLLVGSDAFWLELGDLLDASAALHSADYYLTPALDGGYVQIAARQSLPDLRGVAWSSGHERKQTMRRLKRAGRVVVAEHGRGDFDTPSDWRLARKQGAIAPLVRSKPY